MVLPLLRPNLDHTQGRQHLWLVTEVTAQQPEIVGPGNLDTSSLIKPCCTCA